jgi:hypothetical protein
LSGVTASHAHIVVPDAEAAHTHSVVVPAVAAHTHSVSVNDHPAHSHTVPLALSAHTHTGTIASNGVSETRMPNVAVNFLIKIKPGADYDGGTP